MIATATRQSAQSQALALETKLNRNQNNNARIRWMRHHDFHGHVLSEWSMGNGLKVLILSDPSTKVVSIHTWFAVGSSHERVRKTGQAHLLEHLMFNESKAFGYGEFDKRVEAAGGESNAATWIDWTYYYENVPATELSEMLKLEAARMRHLVIRDKQLKSELEVVANERRYRVDDDVDGLMDERLFAGLFGKTHPYGWPTIGWMNDIQSFSVKDCQGFYNTYYAPNNATLVLVGGIEEEQTLREIQKLYGNMKADPRVQSLALKPLPPFKTSKTKSETVTFPTQHKKWTTAWVIKPYGTREYAAYTLLGDILSSGRSSVCHKEWVEKKEWVLDARMGVIPLMQHGVFTFSGTFREQRRGIKTLSPGFLLKEAERLFKMLNLVEEKEKVMARMELGYYSGLESSSGKADQIGYADRMTGDPCFGSRWMDVLGSITKQEIEQAMESLKEKPTHTVHALPGKKKAA